MNFYRFAKAGLLAAGFLACHSVPVGAQAQGQPYPVIADGSHSLKSGEVLVPAALFGVSALFVHNGWLAGRKENVQDALSAGASSRPMITASMRQWRQFTVLTFAGWRENTGLSTAA